MTHLGLVAVSEKIGDSGGHIEGATPLTGRLSLPALLVREAVQNAWDARDDDRGGQSVRFSIDGWDLDNDKLDDLRKLLPVAELGRDGFGRLQDSDDGQGVLHPAAVLRRNSLRILVISDRNTVGLCGPSRGGIAWRPVRNGGPFPRGQQRFANFVRNTGRPPSDIGNGDGGSFGVGKSSLWMASECGTILIHSRTTDEKGEPIERFIGSIHGEYFERNDGGVDDEVFTGRHFIGVGTDNDRFVEPITGSNAQLAARSLPLPPYADETGRPVYGTSIVIIAPRLFLPWEVEMARLRDAVRWHVWPKRVPGVRIEDSAADMDIALRWNNNEVLIKSPLDDPELRPYASALLDCARRRKSDEPHRDVTARCGNPKKELGEIKFRTGTPGVENVFHETGTQVQRWAKGSAEPALDETSMDSEVEFEVPWGQIALIRREPLLLVRYEPIGGPEEAANEVGVFLSADDPEVESALTKAEPAAHDEWNPQQLGSVKGNHRKTFVRRTLEEILRAKKEFIAALRPSNYGGVGDGEQDLSRRISGGLKGGTGGWKWNESGNSTADPNPREVRPTALLQFSRTDSSSDGVTVHELAVTLQGITADPCSVRLTAGGSAFDSSGPMDVNDLIEFEWEALTGEIVGGAVLTLTATSGTQLTLVVRVKGDFRFRPKVDVEVMKNVA